jgi:hypothetical protein
MAIKAGKIKMNYAFRKEKLFKIKEIYILIKNF